MDSLLAILKAILSKNRTNRKPTAPIVFAQFGSATIEVQVPGVAPITRRKGTGPSITALSNVVKRTSATVTSRGGE